MSGTTCYHCGNTCDDEIITHEEKDFCCTGCRSVYLLLLNNDLCDYYAIENHPGVFTEKIDNEKFDYLNDTKVLSDIVDFQNKDKVSVTFIIPQIHCYSCLWLLEMLHKIHLGITKSKVNYMNKELSLTFLKKETKLSQVVAKLASIGYEPRIDLKSSSGKRTTNKKLLIQLGVSGFGFGNIMFMSFPEYFTGGKGIAPDLYQYFGLVNLFLATIILSVAARDYFTSAWRSIQFKRINLDVPIALGIFTIYTSSTIEVLSKSGFGYFDSMSGLIFFLLLGKLFQSKTFEQFNFERDYKAYFPLSVQKIASKDKKTTVPLHDLRIGDVLFIRNEEIIPADGVLVSKQASIDYSFVTGESAPEQSNKEALVYAGGKVKGAAVEIVISNLPSQSYLTKLWNNSSETVNTKINSLSDQVGQWFTVAVLFLAFISAGYWFFIDVATSIRVFTSILIIACPCALALAIPITYGNTLRILGNKGFYLKNAFIVEQLSALSTLIFDKTGTLTHADQGDVQFSGTLSETEKIHVSSLLSNSIHPLSNKVWHFLNTEKQVDVSHYQEKEGEGIIGLIEGNQIRIGSYHWVAGKHTNDKSLSSEVHVTINDEYRGLFKVKNMYRKGLSTLFKQLLSTYTLEVLSGDNNSEQQRLHEISGIPNIKFNQTPFSKKDRILELKKSGNEVMMIGDGLNDAGALLAANVGVAITDTSVGFTPASDVILEANHLTRLPLFLAFSKKAIKVVYACFTLSLCYNVVGLFFAVRGELSPIVSAILMPVSSVSVLLLSLGLLKMYEKKLFRAIEKIKK